MEKKVRYYNPRTGESGELILIGLPGNVTPEELAAAIGAVEGEIPENVSELINDAGYVDAAGAASAAPVQSVDGRTGTVSTAPFLFEPNNTSTLTSQIDALTANGAYSFYILSYGHQAATGMPDNANYYGLVFRGSANYITVLAVSVGGTVPYLLRKTNGTWAADWVRLATAADVPVLARETFDIKTSFAAGTIGTRGAQVAIDASKAGYTLIGAWIVYIENSSNYHPLVFRAASPATTVYVNLYRCVSTAVSDIDVTVECLYEKN